MMEDTIPRGPVHHKKLSRGMWRVLRWQGEDGFAIKQAFYALPIVYRVSCSATEPVYFLVARFEYKRSPNVRVLRYDPIAPHWLWLHLNTIKSKRMCAKYGLSQVGIGPWNALTRTILVDQHLTMLRTKQRILIDALEPKGI